MVIGSLRLHLFDVHNLSIISNEGDGQWDLGVAHPETVTCFLFEDKKHAGVGGHAGPIHESNFTGLGCIR